MISFGIERATGVILYLYLKGNSAIAILNVHTTKSQYNPISLQLKILDVKN